MLSSFTPPSFLSILKADLFLFVVLKLSLPFVCYHYHPLHLVLGVTWDLLCSSLLVESARKSIASSAQW